MRMCACRGTAGFAHVSCLAEQAKILREEAEYNNLDDEALDSRWARWYSCSLCEQKYYGVVRCALGWACWKTYLGRPEGNDARLGAIRQLGNGLFDAYHHEDALSVQEAELSMHRRLGFSEDNILVVQGNLANAYSALERFEQALLLQRDVYLGTLKHRGNQHEETFRAANNYSNALLDLKRFKETKALLRKMIPVVRRVLGESHEITLQMRWNYGEALRRDSGSTLDDVREAVTSLEDAERTARRVLGGAHPNTCLMAESLENARALLRAYEPSPPPTTSY